MDPDREPLVASDVGDPLDRQSGFSDDGGRPRIAQVGSFYQRYQKIVGGLMLIILITGGINIVYVNRLMKANNGEGFTNPYIIALGIKLFFVMCLMTLFLYNIIFPPDPGEKTKAGEEELDPEGVPFLRPALWFGIFIVLMAATLKHLHH
jgi:hypothetical protein